MNFKQAGALTGMNRRDFLSSSISLVAAAPLADKSLFARDKPTPDKPDTIPLTAYYYQQFDADHSRDVPAEGYGGWKSAQLEIHREHTAVVVMHAWDFGSFEQYPGWYRAEDHLTRANTICQTVLPRLLSTVRQSRMTVFHVVPPGDYYKKMDGYLKAVALANPQPAPPEQIEADPVLQNLRKFKTDRCYPGLHNQADSQRAVQNMNFHPQATPRKGEGIAENSQQLFALCKESRINHLVYTGFAIDWCLLFASGGVLDMSNHGLMCSTIRQAVTAIENKETAHRELCKEIGLWRIAIAYGFVYDVDDFINALR